MKRRFAQSEGDSLELLLDTLCNVFGGVVLIACLLAIVPRASMPPPLIPIELASAEMTERRISSAKLELERLESKINELNQTIDPAIANMQSRRDSLRRTLGDLKSDRKEKEDGEMLEANARAIVAQVNPADLRAKLDQLNIQVVSAENLAKASSGKIEFLEERLKRLSEESEMLAKSKVQAVRFPRERIKDSSPFPLILKYGQLYPLNIGNALNENNAIDRETYSDGEGFRAEPKKGKGMELPASSEALAATLKAAKAQGCYVSIYLYPDSYEAFQELKNAIFEAKISYGLKFMERGSPIGFSSNGSAPPEL